MPDMLGLAGREPGSAGAPYVSPESQQFEMNKGGQLIADTFAAAINFDALPGQTVRLNRPLYPNTTYTQASRQIGTNTAISTTPISVGSEQVDLTIFRFAGPYDQANSRVAPYGLDALDSRMGVHKMAGIIGGNLKRDFQKFLDGIYVLYGESAAGPRRSTPARSRPTTASPQSVRLRWISIPSRAPSETSTKATSRTSRRPASARSCSRRSSSKS